MKSGSLKTGAFELDSVDASGPPAAVTINGASLAFSGSLRQTKKTKAWERYTLSGIASEIAAGGGMGCMYASSANPSYSRVEQTKQSDIDFLKKLCQRIECQNPPRIEVCGGQRVITSEAVGSGLTPCAPASRRSGSAGKHIPDPGQRDHRMHAGNPAAGCSAVSVHSCPSLFSYPHCQEVHRLNGEVIVHKFA